MPLLEIKNLHVEVDGKKILNGLDLVVEKGSVHAIMGPNGSGKSTLAHVLAGKADYTSRKARCCSKARIFLAMAPDERAAKGLFLAFQYPLEIPGVATMTFLRTALNAQRKKRGEPELSTPEFLKRVSEVAGKLGIAQDMLRRGVNVGFSGGEKKRNEILQMSLFEPRLCVLDETNSGLDIDALKVVSEGVNRLRSPERSFDRDHALPAAARLHRARRGAGAFARPHRAAPAVRSWRSSSRQRVTRNIRKRRREAGGSARSWSMNAMRLKNTAAETALAAANFASGEAAPPGRCPLPRCARQPSAFAPPGPAAPARRGVEIHRPARADARCQAARWRPDAAAKARAEDARRHARHDRGPPYCVCRRRLCAGVVRSCRLEPGLIVSFAGAGAWRREMRDRREHLGQARPDRRCRGRAQYRFHGRWRA